MKRRFYFLLFSFLFAIHITPFIALAQEAQVIEWQNTIGGNDYDRLPSIQQTDDGGYILGGFSNSNISGDKAENNNGAADYWIVKTDMLGNIQWQNTIGGNLWDALYSIQQTTDGGYILGGSSYSNISGDKTENNWDTTGLKSDYWIVKTDSVGNIQWQNTIGGTSYDELYSIQQTTDGGYILGGLSDSNISGDKTENSNGFWDYWIIKTDPWGNIQWQNSIGGSYHDYLYSIQQTTDGGYILGGRSQSSISGDKTENSLDTVGGLHGDYWIVKTDALGNIQWENTIGGSKYDELYSIQQTTDGGYILGGSSSSDISGDKTENNWNTTGLKGDYWIVKTDSIGNIQWQNTIGGTNADELYSIQQTTDGGYILGGFSESNISGDKTENSNGDTDYWIVKTDSVGNIQWQNTIGGNLLDELYSIQLTADGGFILGGMSYSNVSGDKTENGMGGTDYWIIKLTDNYNSITGKLFIDANSNAMQDAGEPTVSNKEITEISTGKIAYTDQNGNYNLLVLDTGNFSVYPGPINYYNPLPANHTAYFSGMQQTDSLNDFAFQPAGVFNDMCVTISPLTAFRPGFNASYMISYQNVGTTTVSPTVIFFPDTSLVFVSANPAASAITTDSVVWNLGPMAPYQTGNITVTVNVNIGTPIGTLIHSSVHVEPFIVNPATSCNTSYWDLLTTGSYDPNEILVDRKTILTTELNDSLYLNYIIYFQNTGNDTAFNVKVLNPVDTNNLLLNTFEFVSSSHPVKINYKIWQGSFEFTFDNILLPDSNVNESASHGFVRYRIKPKTTLVVGDSIHNTAAIYFDFNLPVQTNTAITEIVLPPLPVIPAPLEGEVELFPNPALETITIEANLPAADCLLAVYNLWGREVFQLQLQVPSYKLQTTIDVSAFPSGMYFVKLKTKDWKQAVKFVKE